MAKSTAAKARLVVIAGLANSGKMPLARRLMSEDEALVLVHRDTIRDSLVTRIDEWHVTEVMGVVAAKLLDQGHSVVVCAWNLEPEDRHLWEGIVLGHGLEMEWLDTRRPEVAALIPPLGAS